jgi:trans-2,3-dihydro-3-hydroxyanthranilate isomerase
MQRIAKEMNFSETTLTLSDEEKDGGYDVRIFTPTVELPFAGHPTLGTTYLINREIAGGRLRIVLNLKAERILVTFEEGELTWMRQNEAVFGRTISPEEIAPVLGLNTMR